MIEKALRQELNKINEIQNKIYPLNAPEGIKPPYIVYVSQFNRIKTLNELKNEKECVCIINILCSTYNEMKNITKKVENKVIEFLFNKIGDEHLYICDLNINDVTETYEEQVKLHRGIISVTFYYKEG
ncbi:MAG: hypothetical protein HUJ77_12235 [Clostridium sp.]|uniref:hypothetical protein n=1 Tax=Clostridium sp. TaxID=1506 RepID=UPI0025C03C36|nr:hypothetical protein [Clostridium sp.]MCF0149150.1 hypothetical protein [Clostridium sp.]